MWPPSTVAWNSRSLPVATLKNLISTARGPFFSIVYTQFVWGLSDATEIDDPSNWSDTPETPDTV